MAKLSRAEITKVMRDAGFTGTDLATAVGVAYAESGGDPNAFNGVGKDQSYGLMQINMLGQMGTDRRRALKLANNEQLYDPATNARAAYWVFKNSGWNAWTTYRSGKYLNYQDGLGEGVKLPSIPNPLSGVTGGINAFGATFLKGVSNLGAVFVGVVLLVLGVVLLMRGTSAGKVASDTVKSAKKAAKGATK